MHRWIPWLSVAACLPIAMACGAEAGAPALGEPRDLIARVRLVASATATDNLFVREDVESIATVRDDFADTGWKPPVGAETVVELDLQPWLGRPVPLYRLSAAITGKAPAKLAVELLPGCGATPDATLPWPDPNVPLDLGDAPAGCVQLRMTADETVVFNELHLASRDTTLVLDDVLPAPAPATTFPQSGVVEGFYGRPWSWAERTRMMYVLARNGLGAYLYAPKNDPLHRDRWREPYPAADLDRFAALAATGAAWNVKLLVGLSPFIDFRFDTDADYQALKQKALAFLARGVPGIGILADDIELATDVKIDGALGRQHVDLANRLLADLKAAYPAVQFWFCPTIYSDQRIDDNPGGQAYLVEVAKLDPSVKVLWTGTATSSATMTAADMARVTGLIGRKPLVWDNFWANDGGDLFLGRILMGVFGGRTADLPGAVAGIVQNPGIQGSLDRMIVTTFARWLQDPATADAASEVQAATTDELALRSGVAPVTREDVGPGPREWDQELLVRLMGVFDGNAQSDPAYVAMDDAVAALRGALPADAPPLEPAWAALQVFAELAASLSTMRHSGLAADLVDDLWFPLDGARAQGEQGLQTLELLGAKLAGGDGKAERARVDAASDTAHRSRFMLSTGVVQDLSDQVAALAPAQAGFVAPAIGDAFPACRQGETLAWQPFAAADQVLVYGLAGARVEGAAVRWTPAQAGPWEVVAIARGPHGWAVRQATVRCEAANP